MEAVKEHKSVNEIYNSYDVDPTQVIRWKNALWSSTPRSTHFWLLTTHAAHDDIGANWMTYLHNIEENQTQKIAYRPLPYAAEYSYDWFSDGRWLLKADSGVLQFIAPDENYFELVYYDGGRCTSAVWMPTDTTQ